MLASAFPLTGAALSELRCTMIARQTVPQGAGKQLGGSSPGALRASVAVAAWVRATERGDTATAVWLVTGVMLGVATLTPSCNGIAGC